MRRRKNNRATIFFASLVVALIIIIGAIGFTGLPYPRGDITASEKQQKIGPFTWTNEPCKSDADCRSSDICIGAKSCEVVAGSGQCFFEATGGVCVYQATKNCACDTNCGAECTSPADCSMNWFQTNCNKNSCSCFWLIGEPMK